MEINSDQLGNLSSKLVEDSLPRLGNNIALTTLESFIQTQNLFHLINQTGLDTPKIMAKFDQSPEIEYALQHTWLIIHQAKLFNRIGTDSYLWNLGRQIEGFIYWYKTQKYGKNSDEVKSYRISVPEMEKSYHFFQSSISSRN